MAFHNENHTGRLKRKIFDISSELNSSKEFCKKVVDLCKLRDDVDADYACFLNFLDETNEHSKSSMHEVIVNEDEDEDEADKDPQYCMFLKNLTEDGKSYKLEVSSTDEAPWYLKYHEIDESDGYDAPSNPNISFGNNGNRVNSSVDTRDTQMNQKAEVFLNKRSLPRKKRKSSITKEASGKKKISVDSCYQIFLDGCRNSKYGAFIYEGKTVNYEGKVVDSDSDILILDNDQGCSAVNNSEPVTAEKGSSLKKKLIQKLRQPYDAEEYKELLETVEQEKPVCRLLPLRDRSISSAIEGATSSYLDQVPGFRTKLRAAQDEPLKALNLLRGFFFWVVYAPDEEAFKPWLDEDCLNVLPSSRNAAP